MHKRRVEKIAETKAEKPKTAETSTEKKSLAGLHVANNFKLIIPTQTRQLITNINTEFHVAITTAERNKTAMPIGNLQSALCSAIPQRKEDMPLKKITVGIALRDLLPLHPTIKRLIKKSSSATVDKVEFSSDEEKTFLAPVVSLRFESTDEETGKKSEVMYRCTIEKQKITINKITDANEYKKNYYETSNIPTTRVPAPKAKGKD